MADERLRQLERTAAWEGAEAAARLDQMKVRRGQLDAPAQRFAEVLTREGALWLAGGAGLSHSATNALTRVLVEEGLEEEHARRLATDSTFWSRVVDFCRERARREWEPLDAIAVLGGRDRIKTALGIERMPRGTGAEQRRQRREWVARMEQCPEFTSSWRHRRHQPSVMGWEHLLPVRYASAPDPIPF